MTLYEFFLNQKLVYQSSPHFNGVFLTILEHYGFQFKTIDKLWKSKLLITSELTDKIKQQLKCYFIEKIPLPYLLGTIQLRKLTFKTKKGVFIPRIDSLALIASVNLKKIKTALDLCCGSGTLAIALKKKCDTLDVYGSDIDIQALKLAQQNALINNVSINWIEADWFDCFNKIKTPIDLIVTNPPYLKKTQLNKTLNYEPKHSLVFQNKNSYFAYKQLFNLLLTKRSIKQLIFECSLFQKERLLNLFSIFKSRPIFNFQKQFIGMKVDNQKLPVVDIKNTKTIKQLLKMGLAGIVNTDTQMGLISYSESTLDKIKQRALNKHYVSMFGLEELKKLPKKLQQIASYFWPGSYTFIKNNKSYRVPKNLGLLNLFNAIGRVFCTSANISNQKPYTKLSDYQNDSYWIKQPCFIIRSTSKVQSNNTPSLVYNLDTKQLVRTTAKQTKQFHKLITKHQLAI
ncbi:methyltransferase [Mycoplasmoides genitalium]|uniref:Uncharacterized protein MG259 n=1 Tax=Mycoplasma genitalium (strain ATCC 33530 / DSM 19775 / NCTC 10195 / G37) TaxID=243273 RepID=Y259_MYCGE|nr:methyltransferase [Mycoplasmoides genitalium]Q49404.1 RecName: Full=Uncharacterized protein MG259 [Mycoplasmoides genitalium G37]AAC71479.1 modification methylase, HemK family [Mycoplasmoides genitalium G37]ABY79449.1 modification methylase, HemK family [synthetic Mycoplasma genitalium JCVI-1.0]AFQ04581.1 HemK family modification methylase [Mycoplasmoides genitalium M2288]